MDTLSGTALLGLTAEKVFAEDKKTLGELVRELRKKALMPIDTETLLASVLSDRNIFIHRLRDQTWFDLDSTVGRNAVWAFLTRFAKNLISATAIFMAAQNTFEQSVGFDSRAFAKFRASDFWREFVEPVKLKASQIRRRS